MGRRAPLEGPSRKEESPPVLGETLETSGFVRARVERRGGKRHRPRPGDMRARGPLGFAPNRMTPSAFQAPPVGPGTGLVIVRENQPSMSTRFKTGTAKNPIDRLSGDQNGTDPPSVPASGVAVMKPAGEAATSTRRCEGRSTRFQSVGRNGHRRVEARRRRDLESNLGRCVRGTKRPHRKTTGGEDGHAKRRGPGESFATDSIGGWSGPLRQATSPPRRRHLDSRVANIAQTPLRILLRDRCSSRRMLSGVLSGRC